MATGSADWVSLDTTPLQMMNNGTRRVSTPLNNRCQVLVRSPILPGATRMCWLQTYFQLPRRFLT